MTKVFANERTRIVDIRNMSGSGRDKSAVSLTVKYTLFALNVLFWLIGVVMLGVGIYAKTLKELNAAVGKTLPWFMDPSILFIIFGSIVFVLAFLGCIGALRENVVMLKIFEYSIDIIMIAELALGIYVYVDRNRVKTNVKKLLKETIPKYRDDLDLQSIMDWVQENVKCCGIDGYNDWELNIYFNCSSPGSEACGVPYSCCKDFKTDINTQCGFKIRDQSKSESERRQKIYTIGCVDAVINLLLNQQNMILLLVVAGAVIFIQLLATGLAHSLIIGVRRQKAKWHYNNQKQIQGRGNPGYSH